MCSNTTKNRAKLLAELAHTTIKLYGDLHYSQAIQITCHPPKVNCGAYNMYSGIQGRLGISSSNKVENHVSKMAGNGGFAEFN